MISERSTGRSSKFLLLVLAAVLLAVSGLLVPAGGEVRADEPVQNTVEILKVKRVTDAGTQQGQIDVDSGEVFTVGIVAYNPVGIEVFGAQFGLNYDGNYLAVNPTTLKADEAMEPIVEGKNTVDNAGGRVFYAFSRKGDLPAVSGTEILLATMEFTATNTSEDTVCTTIYLPLEDAILGDADAQEIPVNSTLDLEVCILSEQQQTGFRVDGKVMLEGPPDGKWDGTDVGLGDLTTLTDVGGLFYFEEVAAGTYQLDASAPGYLAAFCQNVVVVDSDVVLQPITLLAGDINGDHVVDIVDAAAIGLDFLSQGASEPPGPYLSTDLNRDGSVDVLDLILMARNFGKEGPVEWDCSTGTVIEPVPTT